MRKPHKTSFGQTKGQAVSTRLPRVKNRFREAGNPFQQVQKNHPGLLEIDSKTGRLGTPIKKEGVSKTGDTHHKTNKYTKSIKKTAKCFGVSKKVITFAPAIKKQR